MPLFPEDNTPRPIDPPTKGYYFKVGAIDGQHGWDFNTGYTGNKDYIEGYLFGLRMEPHLRNEAM